MTVIIIVIDRTLFITELLMHHFFDCRKWCIYLFFLY